MPQLNQYWNLESTEKVISKTRFQWKWENSQERDSSQIEFSPRSKTHCRLAVQAWTPAQERHEFLLSSKESCAVPAHFIWNHFPPN